MRATTHVAFQSSPGPKAERCHHLLRVVLGDLRVSILARPEGRALPAPTQRQRCDATCFNPRPARRPSAAVSLRFGVDPHTVFQSSPGPKAERCPNSDVGARRRPQVSILARPEGRALRPYGRGRCRTSTRFNPRPARRPSAACAGDADLVAGSEVSILARPEGRALLPAGNCTSPHTWSFNPRPARRPSAARVEAAVIEQVRRVSILARPEGRALPWSTPRAASAADVSILARPEGRALPARRR